MRLFDYQQKIVDEQYHDGMALFMDMGTGKTFTALGTFLKSKRKKLLVICLATKVDDWSQVVHDELGLSVGALNRGTKKNREHLDNDCLVISFDSSWRLEKELLKWVDDDTYIIVDESHKIKNSRSKVGKFARKLSKKTNHKVILTGTPQSQGYIDFYNQLYFLGIVDMKLKDFEDRYCVIKKIPFNGFPVKTIVGYKRTDELDEIINSKAVYYERDINDDLIPSEIPVKLKKVRAYDKLIKDRVYETKDGHIEIYDSVGKLQFGLRSLASGVICGELKSYAKFKWIKDFVDSYDKRIVIYYNYNFERDLLLEALDGYNVSEYNGRSKDLTAFKENEDGIVICNYSSGSTGINDFVISNVMIMFSLPNSYIDYVQSKKRIDRIGQTKKPLYYYMMTEGTLEEKIFKTLEEGKDFDERLFESYMEEWQK